MERIRIGNDFTIEWSIFATIDGEHQPYDLSGKTLMLKVLTPFNTFVTEDFTTSGNKVVWKFAGKEQRYIGNYDLILIENNGANDMVTVDKVSAFCLVAHTKDEGGEECCPSLSIDHVSLETSFNMTTATASIDVDSELSETSENPVQNKAVTTELNKKADADTLAKVATTGSYDDLSNKPTIPTAVTENTVSGWGFTKNTGDYTKPTDGIPMNDLSEAVQALLGKADSALQSVPEDYASKADVANAITNAITNELNGDF